MTVETQKLLFDQLSKKQTGDLLGPNFERDYMRNYPLVKSCDPVTSLETREQVFRSGKVRRQAIAVLKALRSHPGVTSFELAVYMEVDRHLVARALPILGHRSLVVQGRPRVCKICRRRCVTWRVVE